MMSSKAVRWVLRHSRRVHRVVHVVLLALSNCFSLFMIQIEQVASCYDQHPVNMGCVCVCVCVVCVCVCVCVCNMCQRPSEGSRRFFFSVTSIFTFSLYRFIIFINQYHFLDHLDFLRHMKWLKIALNLQTS